MRWAPGCRKSAADAPPVCLRVDLSALDKWSGQSLTGDLASTHMTWSEAMLSRCAPPRILNPEPADLGGLKVTPSQNNPRDCTESTRRPMSIAGGIAHGLLDSPMDIMSTVDAKSPRPAAVLRHVPPGRSLAGQLRNCPTGSCTRSGSACLRLRRGFLAAVADGGLRADLGDPLVGQAEQFGGIPH